MDTRRPPGPGDEALASGARHAEGLDALGGRLAELVASLQPDEGPAHLRARLTELEAEHRRLTAEFVALQKQHAAQVALGVAAEQLYDVAGRDQAVAALEDLLLNMVGAQAFALLERDGAGRLLPTHGAGMDWQGVAAVVPGEGPLGQAAVENRILLAEGEAGTPAAPLAFVPLAVDGEPAGALSLHALLPQKRGLTAFDHELFRILQRHAGPALRSRARS